MGHTAPHEEHFDPPLFVVASPAPVKTSGSSNSGTWGPSVHAPWPHSSSAVSLAAIPDSVDAEGVGVLVGDADRGGMNVPNGDRLLAPRHPRFMLE